jgi:purine-binding chemotaxis protein CheW
MHEPHAESALTMLVFEVGASRYGIDLAAVREVVRAVLVAPLPGAPPVVEGIIDVRGRIVPVYDIRIRFGMRPRALDAEDRFVLASANERLVALHCERAERLATVPRSAIQRADVVSLGDRRIAGVASLDDGLILLTDLRVFLDDAENAALDAALAALPRPPA